MNVDDDRSHEPVPIDYARVSPRTRLEITWGWLPLLTLAVPAYGIALNSERVFLLGGASVCVGLIVAIIGLGWRRNTWDIGIWGFAALATAVGTSLFVNACLSHHMP